MYAGERHNFSFDVYVAVFQKAYATLERLGEPVLEEKQVCDFIQNIKDPSPRMSSAIAFNTGTEKYYKNFHEATNFMSNFCMTMTIRNNDTRVLSQVDTGPKNFCQRSQGRGLFHRVDSSAIEEAKAILTRQGYPLLAFPMRIGML